MKRTLFYIKIFVLILSIPTLAIAQNLSVLCSFNGTNGANPAASLVQMPNGYFYGTTEKGGTNGDGTMFQVDSTGGITSMGAFNVDGTQPAMPVASLLPVNNGAFYTTTVNGGPTNSSYIYGPGLLIEITTNGVITTLATFGLGTYHLNGSHPHCAPIVGPDNNYYGTTKAGGGANKSDGVVYQFTTNGVLNALYAFGTNGDYNGFNDGVINSLIVGTDGKLYGTASGSGTNNLGYVFSITTGRQFAKLASFNITNGANPMSSLIQAGDGNFYGTTANGGVNNLGTVFKMTPSGMLNTLASFAGTNGANPQAALILANDGNFYGTTYSGGTSNLGTIFQMTTNGMITPLVSFTGTNGANPAAALVQGSDGNFYGTTYSGGMSNVGTVFSLTLAPVTLPPLVLSTPQIIIGSTNFTFQLSGPVSSNYVLQVSTDLLTWSQVSTSTIPTSGSINLSNAISGYNHQFYRAYLK